MTVGEMGKVEIYVSDAGNVRHVRVDEFQFQTTNEFFATYPIIFNEYFPRQQNRA
jgi:DNA-binding helix-hairpin-helix protein with protein kinase domain